MNGGQITHFSSSFSFTCFNSGALMIPVKSIFERSPDIILASDVSDEIKKELTEARKYAEGRGLSIDFKNDLPIMDVKKLVEIKLTN